MNKYLYPEWSAPAGVKAVSTTRLAGNSVSPYDSFNLGTHVGDDPDAVLSNRRQLIQELQLPAEPQWMNQVHGKEVVYIAGHNNGVPTADALWTDQPDCVLSVMTADCLPVLLASKNGGVVAAIHGGWRGLVAGIVQHTVKALPVPPTELVAWFGPAIGPQVFEVGEDVVEAFVSIDLRFQPCFTPASQAGKYLANIYALGQLCLEDAGVAEIAGGDQCTFQDSKHFFSYRRDGSKTGRMASLIWFESNVLTSV